MTKFPLRLPEELKAIATAQAAQAGISLNQYIAAVLPRMSERRQSAHLPRARRGRGRNGTSDSGAGWQAAASAGDRLDAE